MLPDTATGWKPNRSSSSNNYIYIYISSAVDKWSTEHRWNDTNRGKLKWSDKNAYHYHFVHHKSHFSDHSVLKDAVGNSNWQSESNRGEWRFSKNMEGVETTVNNIVVFARWKQKSTKKTVDDVAEVRTWHLRCHQRYCWSQHAGYL